MLFDIVLHYFPGIIISLFCLFFVINSKNFDKFTNTLFLVASILILALQISEAIEWFYSTFTYPTFARVFFSALAYSIRPIIIYIFCLISLKYDKKQLYLMFTPAFVNVCFAFTSFFNGWFFSFNELNEFARGPLCYVYFVICAIYLCLLIYATIRLFRRDSRFEGYIILIIISLCIVVSILEILWAFKTLISVTLAMSLNFYYMFLQSYQNNYDLLTDTFIRRRFFHDVEYFKNKISAVIAIDLNNLKDLNDEFGHSAGDIALQTLCKTVKKVTRNNKIRLYRLGGDEFEILCFKMNEEAVKEFIYSIQIEMKNTDYTWAIGYSLYNSKMSIDEACSLADKYMYENKVTMKNS